MKRHLPILRPVLILCLLIFTITLASAQDHDSAYLDQYDAALKEQIEAAVRTELGVLVLYAVHDRKIPTNVTVFEIYADAAAYQSHIQTAHFKKYKTSTPQMVKALELIDVSAIELGTKGK